MNVSARLVTMGMENIAMVNKIISELGKICHCFYDKNKAGVSTKKKFFLSGAIELSQWSESESNVL